MTPPVFGRRVDGVPYRVRPCAYALVRDAGGRIAVVDTPEGCFLPGGGIEPGETPVDCVVRELIEECGLRVRPGRLVWQAVDIVHAPKENVCFEKRGSYFEATVVGGGVATEHDHVLRWVTPAEAVQRLAHEGQREAVRRAGVPKT